MHVSYTHIAQVLVDFALEHAKEIEHQGFLEEYANLSVEEIRADFVMTYQELIPDDTCHRENTGGIVKK